MPRIVGHYALFEELAHGGMASVHLGRLRGAAGFSRTVAVKRLHEHYARDPDFVSMLLDEARLAARIKHPNVVPVFDVVSCEGELFLVMEYVAGETLSRLIVASAQRGARIPLPITAAILCGSLTGLHAAHDAVSERGELLHIVHRDVSPQNLMVGTDGVARVFDFGVAKAAERMVTTQDGALKGKIGYMSPEQLVGKPVDRRSDIFAAGVVLWETLVGERLFVGAEGQPVLLLSLTHDVQPPGSKVPGLPPALDSLVMRALDREPARRFATARDMAAALEQCVQPASLAEVAAWLQSIAGATLEAKAAMVRRVESFEDLPPLIATGEQKRMGGEPTEASLDRAAVDTTLTATAMPDPGGRRGRTAWIGAAGAALIAIGAGGVWAAASRDTLPSPAGTFLVGGSESTFVSWSEPLPASATPEPAACSSVKVSSSPPPSTKPAPRPVSPSVPSDCNPPFTLDSQGHKRYKKHCFK